MSLYIALFFCILLRGITTESSHCARLGSDHQRVHLVSWYHNTHLSVSGPMDPQRRNVTTGKLDDNDFVKKEWRLVPSQDGSYFEIIHHQYNEPLCAVPDSLAFDKERRSVVTWIPGPFSKHCLWDVKLATEGHYLVKNVEYGEYMYASAYSPYLDKVWLWRKNEKPLDKQYFWDIINISQCLQNTEGITQFK